MSKSHQVIKNEVTTAYANLATAFTRCSTAVQSFAETFGATIDLPASLALLVDSPADNKGKGKRSDMEDGEENDEEAPAAKKLKKEKRIIDPDAPKRPASSYIDYQNQVRASVRDANPEMIYIDVMKLISANWAALDPAVKKQYDDATAAKKAKYDVDRKIYEDNRIIAAGGIPAHPDVAAPAVVKKKKEPKAKEPAAADAPVAAAAPAPAVAGTPAAKEKKEKKVKAPVAAAAPAIPIVAAVAATPTATVKKVKTPKAKAPIVVAPVSPDSPSAASSSDVESESDDEQVVALVQKQPKASTSKLAEPKVVKKTTVGVSAADKKKALASNKAGKGVGL